MLKGTGGEDRRPGGATLLTQRDAGGGVTEWRASGGALRSWSPVPTVYVTEFEGHLGVRFVPFIIGVYDRSLVAGERPTSFQDWERMESYDSEARAKLTEWLLRAHQHFTSIDMIVTSRLVAMGVSVANIALGGAISVTRDRAEFDRRMARALARVPAKR